MTSEPVVEQDAVDESSEVWTFRHEERGWVWECVANTGETIALSSTSFLSMDDCMQDAGSHGYAREATFDAPAAWVH